MDTIIPLPPQKPDSIGRIIVNERVFVELIKGPDYKGRSTFFLYRVSDYHPGHPEGEYRRVWRGQIFFTDLEQCLEKYVI